jgi:hypothetical protein
MSDADGPDDGPSPDDRAADAPADRKALAATADELAAVLDDLRTELERERDRRGPPEPPRGPLGLPRPPTARDLVEFTDEVAIPATISVLEASIGILEALQRAIRMAETGRQAKEGGERAADRAAEGAAKASRKTLSRLEHALDDLQRAVEGDGLPENETASDLLQDARRLRDEVESRVRAAENRHLDEFDDARTGSDATAEAGDAPASDDGDATAEAGDDDPGTNVDVEGELETLKRRYGDDEDDEDADEAPGTP